jgi:Zn finger protein HypA/HybF involved in hydrogenase expression
VPFFVEVAVVHEMSLALEICRIAEEQVGTDALALVREVGLLVGTDSGVEPDSLEFWLDSLLSNPPFAGARLAMEVCAGDDLRVTYLEVEDGGPPD